MCPVEDRVGPAQATGLLPGRGPGPGPRRAAGRWTARNRSPRPGTTGRRTFGEAATQAPEEHGRHRPDRTRPLRLRGDPRAGRPGGTSRPTGATAGSPGWPPTGTTPGPAPPWPRGPAWGDVAFSVSVGGCGVPAPDCPCPPPSPPSSSPSSLALSLCASSLSSWAF